jgi:hypothetical protein
LNRLDPLLPLAMPTFHRLCCVRLLEMADKYDIEVVKHVAAARAARHTTSSPESVLGLALQFRQVELARLALRDMKPEDHRVGRVEKEILLGLPVAVLHRLLVLEEQVFERLRLGYSYSWEKFASEFVSPVSSSCARSWSRRLTVLSSIYLENFDVT